MGLKARHSNFGSTPRRRKSSQTGSLAGADGGTKLFRTSEGVSAFLYPWISTSAYRPFHVDEPHVRVMSALPPKADIAEHIGLNYQFHLSITRRCPLLTQSGRRNLDFAVMQKNSRYADLDE